MAGTNGLDPFFQLTERTKCPDHPTKRKIRTLDEAEVAAAEASRKAGRTIVPYPCPGCGYFHVTGKVDGSDVVHSSPDGILRTAAMELREASKPQAQPVVRIELEPEGPIVPGNYEARRKALVRHLEGVTAISTDEVVGVLACSRHSVSKYMTELGWKINRKGPGALWVKQPALHAVPDISPREDDPELEAAIARHPASRTQESWVIEAFPPGVSVHDYLLTLKTAGLAVEVRVWRAL